MSSSFSTAPDSLSQWGERYIRGTLLQIEFKIYTLWYWQPGLCVRRLADLVGIFVCERVDYLHKYLPPLLLLPWGSRLKCEKRASSDPLDCTKNKEKRFWKKCRLESASDFALSGLPCKYLNLLQCTLCTFKIKPEAVCMVGIFNKFILRSDSFYWQSCIVLCPQHRWLNK